LIDVGLKLRLLQVVRNRDKRYANQKYQVREALMLALKILISVAVLLAAAEAAKRSPFWGAVIVSLPLTSMLAMAWLYWDTRDVARVSAFARDIFYLVPPSLLFFLPFLLEPRSHWPFWLNFAMGTALAAGGMSAMRFVLK
jgi:hypothetical protein